MIRREFVEGLFNDGPLVRYTDDKVIDSDDVWDELNTELYNTVSLKIDTEICECAAMGCMSIWITNKSPLKEILLQIIEEYEDGGDTVEKTPLMSGSLFEIIWR